MRRLLLALLLAVPPGISPAAADATRPVSLPGAFEFLLPLAEGEDYRVMVWRPPGEPPADGWPAIVALDADRTFLALADLVRSQSRNPDATGVLPMVVVGIEAAKDAKDRRARDFTPSGGGNPAEGGAEAFRGFLETVVKPTVGRVAPLDPKRQALFGHSYGGLFALWSATAHPGDYALHAAASPSLWWNGAALMAADLAPLAAAKSAVLVTVAEYDQADDPLTERPGHGEKLAARRMVDNARAFAARLKAAGVPTYTAEFAGETHGSTVPAAAARTARVASHVFRSWSR